MTKALQALIERAAKWPEEMQEVAAETLRMIEKSHDRTYRLTPDDRAALRRSAEDVRKGRFASDKEVKEFFKRARA